MTCYTLASQQYKQVHRASDVKPLKQNNIPVFSILTFLIWTVINIWTTLIPKLTKSF